MSARKSRARPARPPATAGSRGSRIGLALAGGGPLGAIYEIGALAAIAESFDGLDLNDADVYVGVSAGGFISAALVNGFTPHQMLRFFVEDEQSPDRLDPSDFLRPALREYGRRLALVPALAVSAAWRYAIGSSTMLSAFERLGRAIPTGLFSGEEVHRYLSRVFSQPGRTNDFRALAHRLYLVATDLDSGASITFGARGNDHVPISRAVQASAALPGLFPPAEIDGRHFVDGALRKTLHASIALDAGVDLLLCLNPLVPYDATSVERATVPNQRRLDKLVEGGLPVVLSQTFRSIIHSRLGAGLERYKSAYPGSDIVLIEPTRADADIFFSNLFSYASRRSLCEHAYQRTREELWRRRRQLAPLLARHGITLRVDVLRDSSMTLVKGVRSGQGAWRRSAGGAAARALEHVLDDLDRWMRFHGRDLATRG